MTHKIKGSKIGRTKAHIQALFSNQATALIRHGRIKTTHAKCKELRRVVEPLITKAKVDSIHSRRQVARVIREKEVVQKLFDDVAPEMKDRPGGYTQIFQLGPRKNDGAMMSLIQLVGYEPEDEE